MIKKEIYPKTKRIKEELNVVITEKLDGSNLVFFKKDGELYFAQRSNIFNINELEEVKDKLYKGLYQWIKDNKEFIELNEGSAICGEWLGMGHVKYNDAFDKRYYMFAKANINEDFELYNLIYNHELFIYPFVNMEIPACIGLVPIVKEIAEMPNKEFLDLLYNEYTNIVGRTVEGFVINHNNDISKYVRLKNGKLVEYSSTDRKGE